LEDLVIGTNTNSEFFLKIHGHNKNHIRESFVRPQLASPQFSGNAHLYSTINITRTILLILVKLLDSSINITPGWQNKKENG
jgi:hypothetical protein